MKMIRNVILSFAFAVPAFAQTDFAVAIRAAEREPRLETRFVIDVTWNGSEAAKDVTVELRVPGTIVELYASDRQVKCVAGPTIRCTMPAVREYRGSVIVSVVFPEPGTYTVTAQIRSSTRDPRPENNFAFHNIQVYGMPDLKVEAAVEVTTGDAVDPRSDANLWITLYNAGTTATNVVVRASISTGGRFAHLLGQEPRNCINVSPFEVECRFATLESLRSVRFAVPFVAPDHASGGTFSLTVTAQAAEADFDPASNTATAEALLRRLFAVTNSNDGGAGSLRQAILDAGEACQTIPCLIAFRMNAVQPLIQPQTPLPPLRGRVKLDGGASRTVLDGSLLPPGDALRAEVLCELRITNLVVRNFKGHAIEGHPQESAARPACGFNGHYSPSVPLFITHNELAANVRGVVLKRLTASITDNVIRNHGRAGIFVDQSYFANIERNEIHDNGASGIFVQPSTATVPLPAGAEIMKNVIRGNAEWGIARAGGGAVNITDNAIFGNGYSAIDHGLDLAPAANAEVFFARYDAAKDVTVVRGRVAHSIVYSPVIDVYASASLSTRGFPEAEKLVKQFHGITGSFEVALPGDLRGKWITVTGRHLVDMLFLRDETSAVGTNSEWRYTAIETTEISNAVPVE